MYTIWSRVEPRCNARIIIRLLKCSSGRWLGRQADPDKQIWLNWCTDCSMRISISEPTWKHRYFAAGFLAKSKFLSSIFELRIDENTQIFLRPIKDFDADFHQMAHVPAFSRFMHTIIRKNRHKVAQATNLTSKSKQNFRQLFDHLLLQTQYDEFFG